MLDEADADYVPRWILVSHTPEVDVYLLCYKGSSYVHEADPNFLLYFIRWTSIFFISSDSRDLDMFPEAVPQYYGSQAGLYLLRS